MSIFTLVVIALDRYRGIIWPLKASSSKFRAKMMMVMVWLFGTLVALPNLISFHVSTLVALISMSTRLFIHKKNPAHMRFLTL